MMKKWKDRYRVLLEKKVSSSSLIEVTAALVIISMVFSLAIMIYLNVQKNSFFSVKLSYAVMMDNAFADAQKENTFLNKSVNYGDITLYQEVEDYGSADHVKIVRIEVRDEAGKLLAGQKHLVYVSEN